jgi:hypothetical protein
VSASTDSPSDLPRDLQTNLEAADTRTDGGSVPFDVRESTPNSSGPQGAAGDMGVSSEREGPEAAGSPGHSITGTGTTGDARTRTDGAADSSAREWDAPDVSRGGNRTGREDREDEQAYVEGADSGAQQGPVRTEGDEGVDRTVGEPNTMPLGGDRPHDTGRGNPR